MGGAQGALAWGVLTLRWGSLVNQVARHLIEEAAASGARLAQIRGSYELEGPDLALHLRRAWQIYVPGYGGGRRGCCGGRRQARSMPPVKRRCAACCGPRRGWSQAAKPQRESRHREGLGMRGGWGVCRTVLRGLATF